jgi:hypothetical protein
VRSAHLDDGAARLHRAATGSLRTALGPRLRFEVDEWCDQSPRRSWSWRVAGVHATEHAVTDIDASACRVEMSVPWWAPAYLGVIAVALARIRHRVETRT